jgi:hypothetical protein
MPSLVTLGAWVHDARCAGRKIPSFRKRVVNWLWILYLQKIIPSPSLKTLGGWTQRNFKRNSRKKFRKFP